LGVAVSVCAYFQYQSTQDLTRTNTRRAQRAYLLFESVRLAEPLNVGSPIRIILDLHNTGPTPALEVRFSATIHTLPKGAWRQATDSIGPNLPVVDIAANSTAHLEAIRKDPTGRPERLTVEEARLLSTEETRLFVGGAASYNDVFMDSPRPPGVLPDAASFIFQYVVQKRGDINSGVFTPFNSNFNRIQPNISIGPPPPTRP
jgi:hypothetical protein